MSEIPMHPSIAFSSKRGNIDSKIIGFSKTIFENKKIGICFSILINAIYLYFCYYKSPIISIFISFYLLFLVSNIIIYQFKGDK